MDNITKPSPTPQEAYEALKVLNRWLNANDALPNGYLNMWASLSNKVIKAATSHDLGTL